MRTAWQIRLTEKYLFDVGLYFPKLSLVMSYQKMVPITKPGMRIALGFIALFIGCNALSTVFLDTFWCGRDVMVNWYVVCPHFSPRNAFPFLVSVLSPCLSPRGSS
jgi:hypothetical protein